MTDGAIYTPAPPHLRRTSLRTRANKRMLSANRLPLRCLMPLSSNARASRLLGADTNRGAARAGLLANQRQHLLPAHNLHRRFAQIC